MRPRRFRVGRLGGIIGAANGHLEKGYTVRSGTQDLSRVWQQMWARSPEAKSHIELSYHRVMRGHRACLRALPLAGALAFSAIALASPTGARAQETATASPDQASQLSTLQDLVLRANYRQALPAAHAYLARTDLSASARNQGLEILATVHLAMRDEAAAQHDLAELFARDPEYRLSDPEASPVVQSAFARARTQAAAWTIALEHVAPQLSEHVAPILSVRVTEHADALHELRLQYRRHGETTAASVVLDVDAQGAAQGRIPIEGDEAYAIDYWLSAVAPSGHVLGALGSADAPLTIEVPAAPHAPALMVTETTPTPATPVDQGGGDVTQEAWFWVVLGVVVVGAGVGVGVGVAVASEGPQGGSLGNATLPLMRF